MDHCNHIPFRFVFSLTPSPFKTRTFQSTFRIIVFIRIIRTVSIQLSFLSFSLACLPLCIPNTRHVIEKCYFQLNIFNKRINVATSYANWYSFLSLFLRTRIHLVWCKFTKPLFQPNIKFSIPFRNPMLFRSENHCFYEMDFARKKMRPTKR